MRAFFVVRIRLGLAAAAIVVALHMQGGSATSFAQTVGAGATNIRGSAEALAVLDRAREAAGGAARLIAIRTLLLDGKTTTPASQMRPIQIEPIAYRFLLPDSFQEVSKLLSDSYVFSFAAAQYWQLPAPTAPSMVDVARRNKLRGMADWVFLSLLRAPAQFPLSASISDASRGDTIVVSLSNADEYSRRAYFDRKTGRFVTIEFDHRAPDGALWQSRRTVSELVTVDGLRLPRVVLWTLGPGSTPTKTEFSKVLVDKDVSAKDFQRR